MNTKFAENDHRNYNINGEYFDVGDTFSGVKFEKGLEAVNELKKNITRRIHISRPCIKMDFNA